MRNLRNAGAALLLTLAASSTALAQGRTLGARLGASIATLDTDAGSILDEENRTGLVAGVFYNRSLGRLGYQVEVLYTSRGADFGDDGSLDLTYVQIPALLKVNLPVGMLQPGVFAGVAAALKIDCRVGDSDNCDDIEGVEVNDVDFDDVVGDVKNRSWEFSAGLGIPLP